MRIILILISLSFLIISCTDSDPICPEHNETLACVAEDFIGTWEFVGEEDEVGTDPCLSQFSVTEDISTEIVIELPTDNMTRDIKYLGEEFSISSTSDECSVFISPGTLGGLILNDQEITLKNPNHLQIKERILFANIRKIYRRKQ